MCFPSSLAKNKFYVIYVKYTFAPFILLAFKNIKFESGAKTYINGCRMNCFIY